MQKAGILYGELQNCRNKNLTKRKTRNVLRIIDGSVDVGNDRIKKRVNLQKQVIKGINGADEYERKGG